MKNEPHPRNAPGPFYVERDSCMACMAPEGEAPDLMGYSESDCHGCYFHKQPSTPEELERASDAIRVCCAWAVRYGGDDPKLLQRLREEGLATGCDLLEDDGKNPDDRPPRRRHRPNAYIPSGIGNWMVRLPSSFRRDESWFSVPLLLRPQEGIRPGSYHAFHA